MPRKQTAKSISAAIHREYRKNRKKIEDAMETLEVGTRIYLDHVRALSALFRDYIALRAERGLDPQSLGAATTPSYQFNATITYGEVATAPYSAKEQETLAALDEEFPDHPTVTPELESEPISSKKPNRKRTK